MKVILKGDLDSELISLGLKPGSEINGSVTGHVGGIQFRYKDTECSVWPENYTIANWRELWDKLGDVPVTEDGLIDQHFYIFDKGIDREQIWSWFEETFNISLGKEIFGKRKEHPQGVVIHFPYFTASRAAVILSNIDLPLLEKQRKAFLGYTAGIDSFRDEIDGLENFLNAICDTFYHQTNQAVEDTSIDEWLEKPITTIDEAKAFIRMLHDNGYMFHLEDDPHDVEFEGCDPVTSEQCDLLEKRVNEIYTFDWIPYQCPLGYFLQEVDPNHTTENS